MIERFLEMEPAVFATLLAPDIKKNATDIITLSDSDNAQLAQLVKLLAPMKDATLVMCEESTPTRVYHFTSPFSDTEEHVS